MNVKHMNIVPQEIIRKKRDNEKLSSAEISAFIQGTVTGDVGREQVAAFCMAAFFNGFDMAERVALTTAMRDSGDTLQWQDLNGPLIDKHSTGGIGDNVSLMLAPILAACGAYVPMISGRGLGHTGGTLDKLEAIPGYSITPDAAKLNQIIKSVGCAIIGQTAKLAPADKIIYGIRDVTATVENISLVTASIISKKLAEGLDALVLDVKCGSGSFNPTLEDAQELARSLVDVANGCGLATTAVISDMNQPLASCAGNGIETKNAIRFLLNEHQDPRLKTVVKTLASNLLITAKLATDERGADAKVEAVLSNGKAAEKFEMMVRSLGGSKHIFTTYEADIENAPIIVDIKAPSSAHGKVVSEINSRQIGMGVIQLGGGRTVADAPIDHAVGFDRILPIGAKIDSETILTRVHARNDEQVELAKAHILSQYEFSIDSSPLPIIYETVRANS